MTAVSRDIPVIVVTEWEGSQVAKVPMGGKSQDPDPICIPPSAVKKNKKISFSTAQIHVYEVADENNNPVIEPNCWFTFLKTICSWRMSDELLEKVQTARVQDSQTRTEEKRSKYTVYKVVVHSAVGTWFVFRRYAEFHKLHEVIKKLAPDVQLKLPGKKLFGNNLDPTFVAMRQNGLDTFVQNIISHKHLQTIPEVREFFHLDNKRTSMREVEKEEEEAGAENAEEVTYDLGPLESKHLTPRDFQFYQVVGNGSFGRVVLARHIEEDKWYAVKILQKNLIKSRNEAKHIMSERNVLLKTLNHPFLVGLHYCFQTPQKLYFVLDYVNGGELFFHLQKQRVFNERRSRFYAAEMACALGYLHSKGIVYRDLKPENILLDAVGHICLTDFGLSKEGIEDETTTRTFCGTPEYLAPEIIKKEEYDRSVDWWCLGTVLYEMLFGLPPFYSRNTSEMYERIISHPLRLRNCVSVEAKDILQKLLAKNRKNRLGGGLGDFDDVKRHPFFRTIDWDDLYHKRINPPFNPNVRDVFDMRHIDPQFLKQPVPGSLDDSGDVGLSASVQEADEVFAGFSYAPPMAINGLTF